MSNRPCFLKTTLATFIVMSGLIQTLALGADPKHADLTTRFTNIRRFSGPNDAHRQSIIWIEKQIRLGLRTSFEGTNTNGLMLSTVKVRFLKDINALDRQAFSAPEGQRYFFPNIEYSSCNSDNCSARQEVGPLLPDAKYISHYRMIKIESADQLRSLGIPTALLKDTTNFPKFAMLQLATNWSGYFNRASAVTVFEPETNGAWIQVSSYQTISLTSVGAMGTSAITSALQEQIKSFISAFGRI